MPTFENALNSFNESLSNQVKVLLDTAEQITLELLDKKEIAPSHSQRNKLEDVNSKLAFFRTLILDYFINNNNKEHFERFDQLLKKLNTDLVLSVQKSYGERLNVLENTLERLEDFLSEIKSVNGLLQYMVKSRIVSQLTEQQVRDFELVNHTTTLINDILESSSVQNEKIKNEFADMKSNFMSELNKLKDDNSKDFSEFQLIRKQADFFKVAADAMKNSNFWRWGIGVSILLLIGFSCFFIKSFLCDFDDYYNSHTQFFLSQQKVIFYIEIGKRIVFRALIITILLTLLKFSIKNYNAAMHSYTVNMHKSSCFGAVYDISRAITDPETRSALINLAGKEIFTQSKSGYLSNEETKLDLKFIEKVGAVFNKKSEDV